MCSFAGSAAARSFVWRLSEVLESIAHSLTYEHLYTQFISLASLSPSVASANSLRIVDYLPGDN